MSRRRRDEKVHATDLSEAVIGISVGGLCPGVRSHGIEALKAFHPHRRHGGERIATRGQGPLPGDDTDFQTYCEQVLVPVNLGAYATIKEAKRLLASKAIGFSSFDAGTADMNVLNDPEKPCYGQFGGQQSFMVNFALAEAVAKQLETGTMTIESQREFVGRSLGTNVLALMDLIATHPSAGTRMAPWEQDRLMLKTIRSLNETYRSPYARHLDFPIPLEMPPEEHEALQALVRSLTPTGIPDTVAYLTEEELALASKDLEDIGYDPQSFMIALTAPPSPVDYFHSFVRPR